MLVAILFFSSCAIVRPGEVGVKQRFGKLNEKVHQPGSFVVNPVFTKVIKIPTRTVNREVRLNLPSKEGLNVSAEISILYHIESDKAREVIAEVGEDYENVIILSVFRSAAADICAQYYAKDMHSGNRGIIEEDIKQRMDSLIGDRGFNIESVLLKSINLPPGLYDAIEQKLTAEQDAQRMEFVLQTEQLEAERKKIEATRKSRCAADSYRRSKRRDNSMEESRSVEQPGIISKCEAHNHRRKITRPAR